MEPDHDTAEDFDWSRGQAAQSGPPKTEVELLRDRIAQRDRELMEWAHRYDDAVQPLQHQLADLRAKLEQALANGDVLVEQGEAIARQRDVQEARARRLEEALRAAQETCEYACDTKTSDEWCALCRVVDHALNPPSLPREG